VRKIWYAANGHQHREAAGREPEDADAHRIKPIALRR